MMTDAADLRPDRRRLLQGAAAMVAAPFLNLGNHAVFAAATGSQRTYSTRAVDLVKRATVIDMLAPLTIADDDKILPKPLTEKMRADFMRSGVTAMHTAVGIGGPTAAEDTAGWIAAWSGFCGRNADTFSLVGTVADIDKAKAQGKIAVIMGCQNSDHFRKPQDVKNFYLAGQRVSQLTYNSQNLIGSGCTDRVDGGVSEFGAGIIKTMNEVGMLVDTSHCGDRTTIDAVALSTKPIAITHANCRAISGHPRAKPDEAIKALGAKGGVMGISDVRMFVSAKEPTKIDDIIDHVDHVAKLIGVEHIGIGSDMDLYGYDSLSPEQTKILQSYYNGKYGFRAKSDVDDTSHPQRIYDVTEGLIRRGYSDANIIAILGGNFHRLLSGIWV